MSYNEDDLEESVGHEPKKKRAKKELVDPRTLADAEDAETKPVEKPVFYSLPDKKSTKKRVLGADESVEKDFIVKHTAEFMDAIGPRPFNLPHSGDAHAWHARLLSAAKFNQLGRRMATIWAQMWF